MNVSVWRGGPDSSLRVIRAVVCAQCVVCMSRLPLSPLPTLHATRTARRQVCSVTARECRSERTNERIMGDTETHDTDGRPPSDNRDRYYPSPNAARTLAHTATLTYALTPPAPCAVPTPATPLYLLHPPLMGCEKSAHTCSKCPPSVYLPPTHNPQPRALRHTTLYCPTPLTSLCRDLCQ